MKLNQFTDLGLRTLIYLTQPPRALPFTISQAAHELEVSTNHLVKVVNFMGHQGWIITSRGRSGGMRLAKSPSEYRLGTLIRILEERDTGTVQIVNCSAPLCPLVPHCQLNSLLQDAVQAFTDYLDRFTLLDAVRNPAALQQLIRIPVHLA